MHVESVRCTLLGESPRVQDDLFAKVAALVPGIREAESDDDFDLARMMERHRQQSEKIRQEAVLMRQSMGANKCVPPPHIDHHPKTVGFNVASDSI